MTPITQACIPVAACRPSEGVGTEEPNPLPRVLDWLASRASQGDALAQEAAQRLQGLAHELAAYQLLAGRQHELLMSQAVEVPDDYAVPAAAQAVIDEFAAQGARIEALERYQAALAGGIVAAAVSWWQARRPLGYDLSRHLQDPAVNLSGDTEICLAHDVVDYIKGKIEARLTGDLPHLSPSAHDTRRDVERDPRTHPRAGDMVQVGPDRYVVLAVNFGRVETLCIGEARSLSHQTSWWRSVVSGGRVLHATDGA